MTEHEKPTPSNQPAEGRSDTDRPSQESAGSASQSASTHTRETPLHEPRRQHPVAMMTFVFRTLRELIVPLIVIFFLGQGGDSPLFTWWGISLMLSVLFVTGFVSWLRFTWRVEEDELRIEQGLMVRRKRYVPRDRIQAIDISSGPLQRMFGLVRLNVLTAGGTSPEAQISALSRREARAIQEALQVEARGPEVAGEDASWPVYRISRKRLLLAASTAGSFGVALSIVGTLMAQINQVITEEQMIAFMEDWAGGTTAEFWITFVVLAVLAAWLLSLFGTLLRFSGFTLTRNGRELYIRRGLFEKKQITIPYHRIQAVRVVEGILRQPFGFAMVYVENAGFGDEGGKTTVVFPLMRKKELQKFLEEMLPEYDVALPGVRPPGRAFLRYQIRMVVPALVATSALAWFLAWYWLIPVMFGAAGLMAWTRYRDAAAGFEGGSGFLRFRRLARTTVLFHRRRVQSLSVLANWFQRRKELCSISATVASGKGGADFRVDHLEAEDGREWLRWYGAERKVESSADPAGHWPDWRAVATSPAD
jgi:putative membrane protein